MNNYDLSVAYRVYPGISKDPILFPRDKFKLAEVCLNSFRRSLAGLKVKMFVLLDQCPPEYEMLFRRSFDPQDLELIPVPKTGNRGTFGLQIDVLLGQQDSDLVYFAEDDYYYLPDQFQRMIRFIRADADVSFVAPFDHPDCYRLDLHNTRAQLRSFENSQWRTANSTCLTFLTAKTTLQKVEAVFRSYTHGNSDTGLWLSLTKQKIFNPLAVIRSLQSDKITAKAVIQSWSYCWRNIAFGKRRMLWTPIPTIATAVERSCLAPGYDWESLLAEESQA
ncbi:MAG: glycosyltransferase family 2 protein [Bacteroidota bacterium]